MRFTVAQRDVAKKPTLIINITVFLYAAFTWINREVISKSEQVKITCYRDRFFAQLAN